MEIYIDFNMNNNILIKLTEEGKKILANYWIEGKMLNWYKKYETNIKIEVEE